MTAAKDPHAALGFGTTFGERVLLREHTGRWAAPRFVRREAATVPLASGSVQYGLSCFEGLKAYRGPSGAVHVFRLELHARRMRASAERLDLPVLPEADFVRDVVATVHAHQDLVPPHGQGSLYIRPTIAASEERLGVRSSTKHVFAVVVTPMGRAAGRPVSLLVEREHVRAWPGGLGAVKTAANYAMGLVAGERAVRAGFDQVLWLDALERKYVSEAGAMNFFVRLGDEVLTAPLDGTILAGVTRASVIELLAARGMSVTERPVALDELVEAHARGALADMWVSGTAAGVAPVARLALDAARVIEPSGSDLAWKLREELLDAQEGRTRPEWSTPVEPVAVAGLEGPRAH